MIKLKKNECLIYVGETALRAPDGTLLPSVPQYMIVNINEADSSAVVKLEKNERLILIGTTFNEKKYAEERFAALKAGRECPPREAGINLYIKEDIGNINHKIGMSNTEEKAAASLADDLLSIFAMQMRKIEALEKQGK